MLLTDIHISDGPPKVARYVLKRLADTGCCNYTIKPTGLSVYTQIFENKNKKASLTFKADFFIFLPSFSRPTCASRSSWRAILDILYLNFLLCYIPFFRKSTLVFKYERDPLNVLFLVAKEN